MARTVAPKPPGERRRRNVAGDRTLPAEGRRGRPPSPPFPLGPAGQKLWRYLWGTPQATTWGKAHHWGVAERCRWEDLVSDGDGPDYKLMALIQQWEDRWAFNPKGLATLHMWIDDGEPEAKPQKPPPSGVTDIRSRLRESAG